MGYDRRLVGALPVAAIAGALGATLLFGEPNNSVVAQDTATLTQEQRAIAVSLEGAFVKIADTARPATVTITAEIEPGRRPSSLAPEDEAFPELFRRFGLPSPEGPQFGQASGSGVIVRQEGYILTNDHVVANARDNTVTVALEDGTELPGKVLRDFRSDLAVVKVDAGKPLPYVRMADSSKVRVGQWAVAIGSPFGQRGTMTTGIVSALGRSDRIGRGSDVRSYSNLIQTDAAINRGNSGGPLLNIDGELIGINVAIESPSGANAGIGFAIPANTAKTVVEQLITRGKVVRGFLGIGLEDIPARLRQRLGAQKGAYVKQVRAGEPADRAGIQENDVITRFGAREITTSGDLIDAVAGTVPGTRVPVTLIRDRQPRTLEVTVGTFAEEQQAAAEPAVRRQTGKLGMEVEALTAAVAKEMQLGANVSGVLVGAVEPGSPAFEGGLSARDVITAVNGTPVATVEALNRAVAQAKSGDILMLRVLRSRDGNKPDRIAVNVTVP